MSTPSSKIKKMEEELPSEEKSKGEEESIPSEVSSKQAIINLVERMKKLSPAQLEQVEQAI